MRRLSDRKFIKLVEISNKVGIVMIVLSVLSFFINFYSIRIWIFNLGSIIRGLFLVYLIFELILLYLRKKRFG